jgi:menaquinone-specific isochorismate synthase
VIADSTNEGAAFLQDGEGRYVVGFGPFEERASPPPRGAAFYRNDFGLRDPRPWKVPRTVEVMESLPSAGAGEPEIAWEDVGADGFAEVYAEVTEAIGRGLIEKSVPVVTENGLVQSGDPGALIKRLNRLPENLQGYGWLGREEGFIGATPEKLLAVKDRLLKTMALAGTARSDDTVVFEADQKEIREHEYVAGSLAAKLSDIGTVRREARRVMQLGPLVHFETPIEVDLNRPEEPDRLIQHLHPTPALGPLPKTDETLGLLLNWRNRLGCPETFGAPFGLWRDGALTIVVAIRMIAWRGNAVLLPSGCGVIAESRLVNEWRELRIKRDAVKTIFGV